MKRYLPFLIVTVVAVMTVADATVLYRAKRPTLSVVAKDRSPENPDSMHTLGPADAAVTIEEFGDFQCPPCGMLSEPLNQLAHDFPKLRIIFRNFPLVMHQHANEAALAAEAAGLQGHFWQMHDLLYREQAIWSKATDARGLFYAYASMIKCNVNRFKKDMASEQVGALIRTDQKEGSKLGVINTPTIFINNAAVPPASLNPKDLRAAVEEAMKGSKPTGKN